MFVFRASGKACALKQGCHKNLTILLFTILFSQLPIFSRLRPILLYCYFLAKVKERRRRERERERDGIPLAENGRDSVDWSSKTTREFQEESIGRTSTNKMQTSSEPLKNLGCFIRNMQSA